MSRIAMALTAAVAAVGAHQASQVFRGGVELVHLDVSVLDGQRRPVRGLTAEAFTLLEDGTPQPIEAFAAIEIPTGIAPGPVWAQAFAPDVQSNAAPSEGRLLAIVLDDALLPSAPRMLDNARRIARGVIERLGPADRAAIIFTADGGGAQMFTADRGRLLAAVDTLRDGRAAYGLGWDSPIWVYPPGRWMQSIDGDIGLRASSVETLRNVAGALIAAPRFRKLLIFISPGVTVDFDSAARPREPAKGGNSAALLAANEALARDLPEIYRKIREANVTIYPIDPSGLGGLHEYVAERASRWRALRESSNPVPLTENFLAPSAPPQPADLARYFSTHNLDFLETAARNTGGLALVNTNDFDAGLDRIIAENAAYYLIGYVPRGARPASLHRLEVRVNRADVMVRTRTGYQTPPLPPNAAAAPEARLDPLMAAPLPGGTLPMEVAVAPVAVPGTTTAAVTIVARITHGAVPARTIEHVELQARMFTVNGVKGDALQTRATIALAPTTGRAGATYELPLLLTAAPGRHQLRIGAVRESDGAAAVVFADVDVPDFSTGLTLSGVWVEADGTVGIAPAEAFKQLLPVVPTATRTFSANSRASVFFRIHQGGTAPLAPVTMSVRLIDSRDNVRVNATGSIGSDRFDEATRAASHRFGLPLAQLDPGEYVVVFEVQLGEAAARRHVRFSVRDANGGD